MNTPPASPLRLFAPAKINWCLEILHKRSDGFHELDTLFQSLNWGDELELAPARGNICHLRCNEPDVPTDQRNLVVRAWQLMREEFPGPGQGVRVRLTKRIPAGGGLGGGSSDAAAMLVGLNRLWRLRLSSTQLEQLAARLGSDCAFFIRGGTQRATGRGEILSRTENKMRGAHLVVVCPDFPSSTAQAYKHIDESKFTNSARIKKCIAALAKGELQKIQRSMYNVFLDVLTQQNSGYDEVFELIVETGLQAPLLAGSGSSVFAFARDARHLRKALATIRNRFPKSFAARPSQRGISFL